MEAARDIFVGDTINEYLSEDFETGLVHAMCVSDLAARLARELKLSEEEIREVALAGMVHDIGKLKISAYIYGRKEDTMQIEETRYIRRHAQLGEQILRAEGFSKNICDMVTMRIMMAPGIRSIYEARRFHWEPESCGYVMYLQR